jgi:hypothetical protein
MLKNLLIKFSFLRFFQTGLYFDYIIKKIIESLIKNVFIYTSYFFGEKFMIEFLTKNIINYYVYYINSFLGISELNFSVFFLNFLSFIFFILGVYNF